MRICLPPPTPIAQCKNPGALGGLPENEKSPLLKYKGLVNSIVFLNSGVLFPWKHAILFYC